MQFKPEAVTSNEPPKTKQASFDLFHPVTLVLLVFAAVMLYKIFGPGDRIEYVYDKAPLTTAQEE